MDDTISIHCPHCKGSFRDKATRVQSGYSRQCQSCEVVLFFEEYATNKDIKRALSEARQLRHKLVLDEQEQEEAKRLAYSYRPRS